MTKVNLDALIPREDFAMGDSKKTQSLADRLKISELVKGEGFFYSSLRKPDFQRETSDWDREKIASFIKSFLDGDLIPSIILWQAGQYTFVIDGAHRLSALIAWANDDYGDGFISQAFFAHDVDPEQKRVSEQTKKFVNSDVGSYSEYMDAIRNPSLANPEVLAKANTLGFISVQLQWVSGGAEQAETSFFTINQKATPISDTEISLLRSRKTALAMASRAILRSGTGHKYWKDFDQATRTQIENLAKEINQWLFLPPIKTPIKTLDLPLAGKGYSANSLSLVFDLVKLTNNVATDADNDGKETIKALTSTLKIVRRITTTHASSLGLHPAVYFYSDRGRYQPTALLAWIEVIKDFELKNSFKEFTDNREFFETTLVKLKQVTNQVTVKFGSSLKGYKQLKEVYMKVLALVHEKKDFDTLCQDLKSTYTFLNLELTPDAIKSVEFNRDTKSEVFLSKALENAQRCKICRGFIHVNSMTVDHIQRKQDGGNGGVDNGQLVHPYCNTTYKN
jgi:Protein of unknown function DUF262/HNH endonuclease